MGFNLGFGICTPNFNVPNDTYTIYDYNELTGEMSPSEITKREYNSYFTHLPIVFGGHYKIKSKEKMFFQLGLSYVWQKREIIKAVPYYNQWSFGQPGPEESTLGSPNEFSRFILSGSQKFEFTENQFVGLGLTASFTFNSIQDILYNTEEATALGLSPSYEIIFPISDDKSLSLEIQAVIDVNGWIYGSSNNINQNFSGNSERRYTSVFITLGIELPDTF